MNMNKYYLIRKIYLYLFSLIGLVLIIIGCVRLVGLGLKAYIFTKADIYYEYPTVRLPVESVVENVKQLTKEEIEDFQNKQKTSQRQREAAESLAMIIVGLPIYLFHWQLIKKDQEKIISD